jgi:pimeloyl-ACP methyl ester carboxylesterase
MGLLATLTVGCAHRLATRAPIAQTRFEHALLLNGRSLTLHLAGEAHAPSHSMIMYVTGDGGWHRKDLAVYRQILAWGYPVVGISAPEYLKPLRDAKKTTSPAALARDYETILESAKVLLGVSARTPVILVGVSRGADLAVVAAGQGMLKPQLAGVVAVALTKEEEFVNWFRRVRRGSGARARVPTTMQLYEYLPRLGVVPITVIQSTHDTYLPAAEARRLYGADTERRRFQAIESRNHSFSDARPELIVAVHAAIDWVNGLSAAAGPTR